MRKRGELQFEVAKGIGIEGETKNYRGFAVDPDKGDVVANMEITPPSARLAGDTLPLMKTEPSGQRSWDIIEEPAKVSWALANQRGRMTAAPHMLAAAMAQHFNVTPHADSTLTPEGSRMSRSAIKRGLIKPHPKNPTAEATMSGLYGLGGPRSGPARSENLEREVSRGLTSQYQNTYEGHNYGNVTKPEVLSELQMRHAKARVFPAKEKPKQPQGEQLKLF